jgi:DNA helicase-2/ATP-dependent DNA helicase PcrA
LILAGAGSGKTRVLTTRIAYLIQTGEVSPAGVLAVTFTNKAAREMLTRLSRCCRSTRAACGSEHSTGSATGCCERTSRRRPSATLQILDSGDQQSLVKRLAKAQGVDEEKFPPRQLQNFINNCKEAGLRANAVEAGDEFTRRMVAFYADYDAQCNREGVVDFRRAAAADASSCCRATPTCSRTTSSASATSWSTSSRTRTSCSTAGSRCSRDERLRSSPSGTTIRSMYAFRGAHVGNMNEFVRDFAIGEVVKLEQNYRSQGHILDAANAIIAHNKARLGKNLWTAQGKGEPLRVYAAANDDEEARFIVDEVKALTATAWRSRTWRCSTARTRSRASSSTRCSARARVQVYGGCASSSARRSSTRSPTCGSRERRRRHGLHARRELPAARHRRALDRAAAGGGRARHGSLMHVRAPAS